MNIIPTGSLTGMIIWTLIGAYCFTAVSTGTGAHELIEKLLLSIPGGRYAILITMTDIYESIIPFGILQGIGLIIVIIFPEIALWLPQQLAR